MSEAPHIPASLMAKRRRRVAHSLRRRVYLGLFAEAVAGLEPDAATSPALADASGDEGLRRALAQGEAARASLQQRLDAMERQVAQLQQQVAAGVLAMEQATARAADQERELEQARAMVARAKADMDNQRRRMTREREEFRRFAAEETLRALLPVLDNFRLAVETIDRTDFSPESLVPGVRMIHRDLCQVLSSVGLARIETAGQIFDPTRHDAASTRHDPERPDGEVLEEVRPGYSLRDRVLRPAMVIVNKHPTRQAPSSDREGPTPPGAFPTEAPTAMQPTPLQGRQLGGNTGGGITPTPLPNRPETPSPKALNSLTPPTMGIDLPTAALEGLATSTPERGRPVAPPPRPADATNRPPSTPGAFNTPLDDAKRYLDTNFDV
jgi:molecular chaperone GrpE